MGLALRFSSGIEKKVGSIVSSYCGFIVFRRKVEATQFLRIHKRANQFLEEFRPGDLERECIEEKCSFEEAKEIFKSQEKTTEFWFDYKASTKENLQSRVPSKMYTSNTEKVDCWYKNGGCSQYCQDTEQSLRVICSCALGYTLSEDGKRCMPSDRFPCGLVKKSTRSFEDESAEHNQTNAWDNLEVNETVAEETLARWNQTSAQVGLNQTMVQGGTRDEDVEEKWGSFTEGDLQTWLNYNSTSAEDGARVVGGTFCRPGDCPWQV
ncbi:hypothetical protein JD844_007069 [Phrynosoma platyrhinos]|uniref:Gla domain-containing protein n=1 Tax=Phrynosoma platyrhinos TaxID=52577 RepID=A0ABQ7T331_PHRPL|nr:hypothetical protein JD844_007069 [Phrynosoma platyrhinos]